MDDGYITRYDAFTVLTEYYHHKTAEQHEALLEALSRVPAADVRPVVLCCSCEHYKTFGCSVGCGWCEAADRSTYADFFCASGRWKSNGADMREVQDG